MAEYVVIDQASAISFPADVSFEVAAIIGCAVVTGVGAVINTARVRAGSSAAVIGCGGIGLSVVQGCKLAGCHPIIAIDVLDSKLEFARQMGATETINARDVDVVKTLRALTRWGSDHVFDMVGSAVTIPQALLAVGPAGTVVVAGLGAAKLDVPISAGALIFQDKRLLGSFAGSMRPHIDLPLVPALVLAALPAGRRDAPRRPVRRDHDAERRDRLPARVPESADDGVELRRSRGGHDRGQRRRRASATSTVSTFHRVEPGFVIQGGDPKGNGSGGPGYQFPNEVSPDLKHDGPGVLAMANSGPHTNGSQFYITMRATPQLDGGYSVFGKVVQGQDVVAKIAKGDRMTSVKILRIGADAQAFTVTQAAFDALVAAAKAAVAEKARKDREAALAAIAKKYPGLKATPSGLQYKIVKQGSGASPKDGASVTVHYTGWLLDGTKFDSSKDGGSPATFRIGEVIEGWNEALKSMKKGETRLLVIPPELGYGERGYPGVIPGNAFLVFEVELISF